MSADDQVFLDILSSVPNDIRKYSNDIADYVDRHLDQVSNVLRDALSSSKWIPESARPKPPPPPPRSCAPSTRASFHAQVYNWAMKNKVLTAVIVSAVAGFTFYVIKRKSNRKKRRAKRASNGARLEVIVIAGQPSEPITRSISLDLERRGFIVYVVCNTIEEEVLVQNESRPDIKSLMLDIVDTESAKRSIERFTAHLQTPHSAFSGAKPHHLTLRSLIIIPSSIYPSGPIATLSPGTYWDLLHSRLLTPIITLQYFLPLLQNLPLPHPTHHAPTTPKPSILLLTPSIISSLSPAFHLSESTITSALSSFTSVLQSELAPLSIPVSHLQLGTFDTTAFAPHRQQLVLTLQSQRAETLRWDDSTRASYGRNFVESTKRLGKGGVGSKGSSLRELNDAVFDAMVRGRGGVVRVGMGAGLYGWVGNWVPRGVIGWMMGLRRVGNRGEFGREENRSESPGSIGGGSRSGGTRLGESDFVSVYGGEGGEEQEYKPL